MPAAIDGDAKMQTLLLIHADEAAWAALPEAERGRLMGAYAAYSQALLAEGIMRSGARLTPAHSARILGRSAVLDGPYAETREQLGGFYLLETPDMATAEAWAARCPALEHGATVELRALAARG
jgi:hypothetical protein